MKVLGRIVIIIFITSIVFTSCEVDDGDVQTSQVSSTLEVNVPDTMITGQTYPLEITYQKYSNCHQLSGFDVIQQGDSLIFVRAITLYTQAGNCNSEPEPVLEEVDFTNTYQSDFTFKFLKDIDSLGEFVYIDKDIIVEAEEIGE
jgi:hypothetical protein